MICSNCGCNNPDGAVYCSSCGSKLPKEPANIYQYEDADSQYSRLWAVINYFSVVGWIISLAAADKNNTFIRRHQNNGIVLHIVSAAAVVVMFIPIIGWIVGAVAYVWSIVDVIYGIVWSVKGKTKEVPLFGKIHILK